MFKLRLVLGLSFLSCTLIARGNNRRSDADIQKYCEVSSIYEDTDGKSFDINETKINDENMLTFYVKSNITVNLIFLSNDSSYMEGEVMIALNKHTYLIMNTKDGIKKGRKYKKDDLISPDEWRGFWIEIPAEGTTKVGEKGDNNSMISWIPQYYYSGVSFSTPGFGNEPFHLAYHCQNEIDIEEKCQILKTSCMLNNSAFSVDDARSTQEDFFVQFYAKFGSLHTFIRLFPTLEFSNLNSAFVSITSESIKYLGPGKLPDFEACERNSSSMNNSGFSVGAWEGYWFQIDISQRYFTIGKTNNTHLNTSFNISEQWKIKYYSFFDFSGSVSNISLAHQCNFTSARKKSAIIENDSAAIENNSVTIENNSKNNDKSQLSIFMYVGIIVIIVIVVNSCSCFLNRRQKKEMLEKIENANALNRWMKTIIIQRKEHFGGFLQSPFVKIELNSIEVGGNSNFCENSEYKMIEDSSWEFGRENLKLGELLGEGEFGQVIQAEANGISGPNTWTTVAVKMLKGQHTDEDMINLVSELEIMKLIGNHKYILRLLGCCTQKGPLFIIMEYAHHGNLKNFLRDRLPIKNKPKILDDGLELNNNILISFANQIALGMEYLSSIKCIHRDLAARNVLVCKEYVMKIADFGLARDVHEHDYYKKETKGKMPIKWMPPEAIFHKLYTCQSDVWSYGILLWEIMTFGGIPYPGISNGDELITLLHEGYRMKAPPNCPVKLYELMKNCWTNDANDRPSFSKIVEILNEILADIETIRMPEIEPSESVAVAHKNTTCAEIHIPEPENVPLLK